MTLFQISLDIFSGNPNPSWELPEDKVKEFFEIEGWKEIMNPEDHGVSLDLGYRGFIISSLAEADEKLDLSTEEIPPSKYNKFPHTFRIFGSKKLEEQPYQGFKPSHSIEEIREKEKWLLNTAPDNLLQDHPTNFSEELKPKVTDLSNQLKQLIVESIDKGGVMKQEESETYKEEKRSMVERVAACNTWGQYYNPGFWNDPRYIRLNNCYNYAMNRRTNTFAQPGRAHNCSFSLNCASVAAAARCDGVVPSCVGSTAYYYIALVIWPNYDYHWYHWNVERFFSHKPGQTAVRNTDNSGRIIRPESPPYLWPHNCNRGPYTAFCGYYYGLKGAIIR